MEDLPVEQNGVRFLTREEFRRLSDVPPEAEWFGNIDNENTRAAYRNDVGDFVRFAGIERPEEMRQVTRAHVLKWRKSLEDRLLSPASIRRRLSSLSALFNYLCERNAIEHNPVQGVKRPNEGANEGPAISDTQARQLLQEGVGVTLELQISVEESDPDLSAARRSTFQIFSPSEYTGLAGSGLSSRRPARRRLPTSSWRAFAFGRTPRQRSRSRVGEAWWLLGVRRLDPGFRGLIHVHGFGVERPFPFLERGCCQGAAVAGPRSDRDLGWNATVACPRTRISRCLSVTADAAMNSSMTAAIARLFADCWRLLCGRKRRSKDRGRACLC